MSERRSVIRVLRPARPAGVRVLVFPYAGGSTNMVSPWIPRVPEGIELCAVVLPARETRRATPVPAHVNELIGEVRADLLRMPDAPLVLFGHSMGAIIAHDFAHALLGAGHAGPLALFASGSEAPHVSGAAELAALDDDGIVRIADERWDGFPDELRAPGPLRASIIALVRADLAMLATCARSYPTPLSCPIHVFGGDRDPRLTRRDFEAWGRHTSSTTSVRMFSGGHLFVTSAGAEVADAVVEGVRPLISHPRRAQPLRGSGTAI